MGKVRIPALKLLVVVCALKTVVLAGPPLQLESSLSHLTNILQDRDQHRLYDDNVPKEPFKGKHRHPASRLAPEIIPTHYTLFIRPILDEEEGQDPSHRFTAPGIVKIHFRCSKPTSEVLVHAVELDILDDFVEIRNRLKLSENFGIAKRELKRDESIYSILLEQPLQVDKEYILTIAFTSLISKERLTGLYLSNYTDPVTDTVKYIATTQFESVNARQAFPCFDEPDLKATFDVSIGRKVTYNSISNMNLLWTEPIVGAKDWVWDHYNTTMRMSTYLLAFIVSDFTCVQANETLIGGKPVKTCAPKHLIKAGSGAYAAQVAARVLNFYQNYFQTSYPLPKMDSIAIPHFQAGAMENWGANMYREKLLLHDGNKTSESERYSITSVISHELGHQNFGNLVTCKRWTHLWLNEGFATYASFLGVDSAAPEFRPKEMLFLDTLQVALQADTGPKVHPLVNDTLENRNSTGDFSKITYKKGASLIHMMEGFLGHSTLRQGLQEYLKKYAYDSAVTEDLFSELDRQARKDKVYLGDGENANVTVSDVMTSYTLKSGYPLVKVRRYGSSSLLITQEKFEINSRLSPWLSGADPTQARGEGGNWWVPLSIKFSVNPKFEDTRPDFWLGKDVLMRQWSFAPSPNNGFNSSYSDFEWLIVNPHSGVYSRIIYDSALTEMLQNQLSKDHKALPAIARAKLVDDYFNAASAEYVSYAEALTFTEYLDQETEYVVWSTIFLNMKKIYNMYRVGRQFNLFTSYFRPKVVAALDTVGMEQKPDDKGMEVLLRTHLLDWACNLEYIGCNKFALKMMKMWMNSSYFNYTYNPIPVDIQPVVYCAAVATSGSGSNSTSDNDEIWNFVWRKYQEAETTTEKFKLISALCCSQNTKLLSYLMDEALNETSRITKVDSSVALQRLAASTVGNQLVFSKIKKDFNAIVKRFGGSNQIAYAISSLSIYWNESGQLEELKKFVKEHEEILKPAMKLLKSSIRIVENNIGWMKRFDYAISSWMEYRLEDEARI